MPELHWTTKPPKLPGLYVYEEPGGIPLQAYVRVELGLDGEPRFVEPYGKYPQLKCVPPGCRFAYIPEPRP